MIGVVSSANLPVSPPADNNAPIAPVPETMILTYRYKLLLKKRDHARFQEALEHTAQIYNAALEEQIDPHRKYLTYIKTADDEAYAQAKREGREKDYPRTRGFTSKFAQYKGLTELREDPDYARWPVTFQRWAVARCQDAFKGFFSRVKRGDKPGFPRFRSTARLRAFGFTDSKGWTLHGNRLTMKGIGRVRMKMHRPLPPEARLKTLTVSKGPKGWYACFAVEVPITQTTTDQPDRAEGMNVGVINALALSDGTLVAGPRFGNQYAKEVRKASRALARCQRGSRRREKVRARLARLKARETNARSTHLHQAARSVANRCEVVYVEALTLKGMMKKAPGKRGLNRSLQDAALGSSSRFCEANDGSSGAIKAQNGRSPKTLLVYKMRLNGGLCIEVDPRYSSQTCAKCGHCEKKNRKGAVFLCLGCGHKAHADINAVEVLKIRGVVAPGTHKLVATPAGAGNISFSN
jgi:putative transposase